MLQRQRRVAYSVIARSIGPDRGRARHETSAGGPRADSRPGRTHARRNGGASRRSGVALRCSRAFVRRRQADRLPEERRVAMCAELVRGADPADLPRWHAACRQAQACDDVVPGPAVAQRLDGGFPVAIPHDATCATTSAPACCAVGYSALEAVHPRDRSSAMSSSVEAPRNEGRDRGVRDAGATTSRFSASGSSRSSCSMRASTSASVNLPSPCRWVNPIGPRALRKSA